MSSLPNNKFAGARAVVPLLLAVIFAGFAGYCIFPHLEKRVLFSLQKWVAAAFLLNLIVIFIGTLDLIFHERSHHKNPDSIVTWISTFLALCSLVACVLDIEHWRQFAKTDCQSKCSDALVEHIHASEWVSLIVFAIFVVLDWLEFRGSGPPVASTKGVNLMSPKSLFYQRCIWIVDFPVCLVVLLTILAQMYTKGSEGDITFAGTIILKALIANFPKGSPELTAYNSMVAQSFAVGVIFGHILLSQLAFTYLKWEYYRSVVGNKKPIRKVRLPS